MRKEWHLVFTMVWCGEHRAFVVEFWLKNEESFVRAQHVFKRKYQLKLHDSVPSHLTMSQWLANFSKMVITTNIHCHSNERMVRMLKNVKHVRSMMEYDSRGIQTLLRRAATSLHLLHTALHQIPLRDLSYHLYKLQVIQELKLTDFAKKWDFCKQFLCFRIPDTDSFFPNEKYFKLNS